MRPPSVRIYSICHNIKKSSSVQFSRDVKFHIDGNGNVGGVVQVLRFLQSFSRLLFALSYFFHVTDSSFLSHITGNHKIRDWVIVRAHVWYHLLKFQNGRLSNVGGDRKKSEMLADGRTDIFAHFMRSFRRNDTKMSEVYG